MIYNHVGNPLRMNKSVILPRTRNRLPATKSHFRRFVQVMRKPVAKPMRDAMIVGIMRRRPDVVALSRRMAWK